MLKKANRKVRNVTIWAAKVNMSQLKRSAIAPASHVAPASHARPRPAVHQLRNRRALRTGVHAVAGLSLNLALRCESALRKPLLFFFAKTGHR